MKCNDEAYNEWASEHLLDRDDEAAWHAARNHGGTTTEQMVTRYGAERAEVEGAWAARRDAERTQSPRRVDYPRQEAS